MSLTLHVLQFIIGDTSGRPATSMDSPQPSLSLSLSHGQCLSDPVPFGSAARSANEDGIFEPTDDELKKRSKNGTNKYQGKQELQSKHRLSENVQSLKTMWPENLGTAIALGMSALASADARLQHPPNSRSATAMGRGAGTADRSAAAVTTAACAISSRTPPVPVPSFSPSSSVSIQRTHTPQLESPISWIAAAASVEPSESDVPRLGGHSSLYRVGSKSGTTPVEVCREELSGEGEIDAGRADDSLR